MEKQVEKKLYEFYKARENIHDNIVRGSRRKRYNYRFNKNISFTVMMFIFVIGSFIYINPFDGETVVQNGVYTAVESSTGTYYKSGLFGETSEYGEDAIYDDETMALIMIDYLIENEDYDEDILGDEYIEWAEENELF